MLILASLFFTLFLLIVTGAYCFHICAQLKKQDKKILFLKQALIESKGMQHGMHSQIQSLKKTIESYKHQRRSIRQTTSPVSAPVATKPDESLHVSGFPVTQISFQDTQTFGD